MVPKCALRNCYYATEENCIKDKQYLMFLGCENCDALYHTEECLQEDIRLGHKIRCPRNKQNKKRNGSSMGSLGGLENYITVLDKDKCLGKGAYGYVTLVKHKHTNQIYAMKVISVKFVQKHGGDSL
jgi:NAD-dependent dihydropyrimidine dehydrogenase PreA subunit